jgi:glutamyl/glutaminyl-tRNA synthetase
MRTRFAPSPTGSLHVGGVRTALYCLLYARKHGGTFVLRIEDTDQQRSTDEAAAGIMRDLAWCGLAWDEGPGVGGEHGPYFQSRKLEAYNGYVERLIASGHAYEAWESREELEAMRKAAESKKETFRYRKHRDWTAEEVDGFRAAGRVPVVRLKAPNHDLTVDDRILGPVTVAAGDLEDIVIRKADGFPTYHFAVVIDDHEMKIDQVLRGKEHLLNTHKHLGVYEAFGWTPPHHGHLPLIFNPQGQKMSKREKAATARDAARKEAQARKEQGWQWLADLAGLGVDDVTSFMKKEHDRVPVAEGIAKALNVQLPMIEVLDFRRGGYLPEALVNYLALLGWSPGDDRELMGFQEMVDAFDLSRVKHSEARFDPDKLKWMNGEYIKRATPERLLAALDSWLEVTDSPLRHATEAQRRALFAMYQQRVATLSELDQMGRFFFERPASYDEKAAKKWLSADGIAKLRRAREAVAAAGWTAAELEAAVTPIAPDDLGSVAQPIRIALKGNAVTPPLFDTIVFFTREEALARIDACLARFPG